jgi:hypothetical protein
MEFKNGVLTLHGNQERRYARVAAKLAGLRGEPTLNLIEQLTSSARKKVRAEVFRDMERRGQSDTPLETSVRPQLDARVPVRMASEVLTDQQMQDAEIELGDPHASIVLAGLHEIAVMSLPRSIGNLVRPVTAVRMLGDLTQSR